MKRIIALVLCLIAVVGLCSCGKGDSSELESSPHTITFKPEKPMYSAVGENGSRTEDEVGFQLAAPNVGETVAVFETTMGDIVIRLFDQSAPITVTNFKGLIENKYYDGISFHRVVDGFMIQGGDPTATGMEGSSVWGDDFEDEFNANLLNLRGSLSMANSGANTNGSQFFINQSKTSQSKSELDYDTLYKAYYEGSKDDLVDQYNQGVELYGAAFTAEYPDAESYVKSFLEDYIGNNLLISTKVPDEVWELYRSIGGNITLDGAWKNGRGHSVFGQVVVGIAVVDSIAAVETDEDDKPLTDVIIKKAYLTAFTEEMKIKADAENLSTAAQN